MVKVTTILGSFEATLREELCNLLVEDIELMNRPMLVQILNTKT